jgi:glycosyltransferase involved in cell wall biosynthesis
VGTPTAEIPNHTKISNTVSGITVALLTGGGDKPYAFGLVKELVSRGASVDLIGSDDLDFPEFRLESRVNFLNLRGDQRPHVGLLRKSFRVLVYYVKLIRYAATARPKIFHILWNNKFELFDRTLLMLYYKFSRKKLILTVHNVNREKRDSKDSLRNRLSLRMQYRLADHIFVHTNQMKNELVREFGVPAERASVIPFGINNAVPNTDLSRIEARRRLGISQRDKVILFFGNITPYKGLEYLTAALQRLADRPELRLIIAGWPKDCDEYWRDIRDSIEDDVQNGRILLRAEYISDEETEVYFKAADVFALPYRHIYQSGVLFLGYSFGLPVIAADVGSLREEIVEGKTGFVFRPENPTDLAGTIDKFFRSDLYSRLTETRQGIREFALQHHSWDRVGQVTMKVYASLLSLSCATEAPNSRVNTGTHHSNVEIRID